MPVRFDSVVVCGRLAGSNPALSTYIVRIAEESRRAGAYAVDSVVDNSESNCSRIGKCLQNSYTEKL